LWEFPVLFAAKNLLAEADDAVHLWKKLHHICEEAMKHFKESGFWNGQSAH